MSINFHVEPPQGTCSSINSPHEGGLGDEVPPKIEILRFGYMPAIKKGTGQIAGYPDDIWELIVDKLPTWAHWPLAMTCRGLYHILVRRRKLLKQAHWKTWIVPFLKTLTGCQFVEKESPRFELDANTCAMHVLKYAAPEVLRHVLGKLKICLADKWHPNPKYSTEFDAPSCNCLQSGIIPRSTYDTLCDMGVARGHLLNIIQANGFIDQCTPLDCISCSEYLFTSTGLQTLRYYIEQGCSASSLWIWYSLNQESLPLFREYVAKFGSDSLCDIRISPREARLKDFFLIARELCPQANIAIDLRDSEVVQLSAETARWYIETFLSPENYEMLSDGDSNCSFALQALLTLRSGHVDVLNFMSHLGSRKGKISPLSGYKLREYLAKNGQHEFVRLYKEHI